jgi:hypothetical protein
MTPPTEDAHPALDSTTPRDQADAGAQEKGRSRDENVAGWAFMMRPLRRKGARAGETPSATPLDTGARKGAGVRVNDDDNGPAEDDRESAQSKGNGYDLVHTETLREVTSEDELLPHNQRPGHSSGDGDRDERALPDNGAPGGESAAADGPRFKVYKRRWFGVVQLVLLNTIISWDVSAGIARSFALLWLERAYRSLPRLSANNCYSGSPSRPTRPLSLSTMRSPNRRSTGSAHPFSLRSSSYHPSSS